MDVIPKKPYSYNLTVVTVQRIKELATIYNCNEEWVIECLINEFYKDEKKRQESRNDGLTQEK